MAENDSKALEAVNTTEYAADTETCLTGAPEATRLRDLEAGDIFKMVAVIKAIGLKEFKGVFEREDVQSAIAAAQLDGEDGEIALNAIGMAVMIEVADVLVENIGNAEGQIYALLASLSGMTAQEVSKLPLGEFVGMLRELFGKREFADFLAAASKLTK